MSLTVLGINCAFHESAAAVVNGARIVAAAEEERFNRRKHGKRPRPDNADELPLMACMDCLRRSGVSSGGELAAVAYSLQPGLRRESTGIESTWLPGGAVFGSASGEAEFDRRVRRIPELLAHFFNDWSVVDRFHYVDHHVAHAASAFYTSPFAEAALLVLDGIGEAATGLWGVGRGAAISKMGSFQYPHSLGMLWERFAAYLGFDKYDAAKVMSLAAYGDPQRFRREMQQLLRVGQSFDGICFYVDNKTVQIRSAGFDGLERAFGPRRERGEPADVGRFADVAAALQLQSENAILHCAHSIFRSTGMKALAYSGGVALNCVANSVLERQGPFEQVHIYGAAHDAGTSVGAALLLAARLEPSEFELKRLSQQNTLFIGSEFSDEEICSALGRRRMKSIEIRDAPAKAAELLADGKTVAWFQGAMEFGPRALGNRSVLADPRSERMRERLNREIKHRERFRPFAASILDRALNDWYTIPDDRGGALSARDAMLFTYPAKSERKSMIPAVLHVDGTSRIQVVTRVGRPQLFRLIECFELLTGVPLVLNTSFNDREPIVRSPDDALDTFVRSDLDVLFLGNEMITKQDAACRSK
jgi:carbamoyltransferase